MRPFLLALSLILLCAPHGLCASLRVVTEEWPPYNYTQDGAATGLMTEVVRATLDRAGIDYTIEVLPWARAYALATHAPNVLIYTIVKLPEREQLFRWVRLDGLNIEIYLLRPKYRTDIKLKSLEEAKAYRVGLTLNSAPHQFLLRQGFVEGVNLFPVNSEILNVHKSEQLHRRIDLATGDPLFEAFLLRQAGLPADYWVRLLPLFNTDTYMALSLGTPEEVMERVRTAFRRVCEDGVLDAVVAKYRRMLAQ